MRTGSVDTFFNNYSTEDESPDLEKLKHPLVAYLSINSLRNKIIDLKEIMSYLSPD